MCLSLRVRAEHQKGFDAAEDVHCHCHTGSPLSGFSNKSEFHSRHWIKSLARIFEVDMFFSVGGGV